MWIDTHCHLDAPEFARTLPHIISAALDQHVQAILLPTVKAADCQNVKNLVSQYGAQLPGLVYTLGIHPLYSNQFQPSDLQVIDQQIVNSQVFQPVNKRFVDAGMMQIRMRPDQVFVPQNMRVFSQVMEQQGQPFDYVLYATLTSGTTRDNKEYQRDYLLTLELVDVRSGQYDKQSATVSKGYYHSPVAKWMSFTGLKR